MATKQEMDEVWCGWIPDDGWPCRACVGTDLHAGDLVEIKLTATRPDLD
jgi:enamine deaminase RidA (YjgF/YER057c/UK114 family)